MKGIPLKAPQSRVIRFQVAAFRNYSNERRRVANVESRTKIVSTRQSMGQLIFRTNREQTKNGSGWSRRKPTKDGLRDERAGGD